MECRHLVEMAFEARDFAYAPYSGFKVGAALLTEDGEVYTGCNIENASLSPTVCAERTAFFKAISEGKTNFEAIAVVGAPDGAEQFDYVSPCGVCRQVMQEFCDENTFKIVLAKSVNDFIVIELKDLLPMSFKKENLY